MLGPFVLSLSKHERLPDRRIAFAFRQTQGERSRCIDR
jgi:hypothetical protein